MYRVRVSRTSRRPVVARELGPTRRTRWSGSPGTWRPQGGRLLLPVQGSLVTFFPCGVHARAGFNAVSTLQHFDASAESSKLLQPFPVRAGQHLGSPVVVPRPEEQRDDRAG